MNISIPVSIGELVDKLTILEIKSSKITDDEKLKNVRYEYMSLKNTYDSLSLDPDIVDFYDELYEVNLKIWDLENEIRKIGLELYYTTDYIKVAKIAKQIYISNDLRSTIKKNVNLKYNSEIVEEKSHTN
jgi:hypothetical protein